MFIINKQIAVQTQGIRYIQKLNSTNVYNYGINSGSSYGLRIKYKAAELVEYFQTEAARDEFFNDLVTSITKVKT